MIGLFALLLTLPDTLPQPLPGDTLAHMRPAAVVADTTGLPVAPLASIRAAEPVLLRSMTTPSDTGDRKRPRAIEYSEWYGRRVAIHKTLSWAMFPLFAVSYYTGDQLAEKGRAGVSGTVRTLHPYAAGGAAAVFGVNTVTGLWNLWDARKDPADRKRRYLHSALFILADAGFAYAGSLGDEAGDNGATRRRHRNIALGSMGASTAGWLIMFLKKD
jgi:hypothetical protein